MTLTKRAREVFAGYTAGGAVRMLNPAEASTWGEEIEQLCGAGDLVATARLGKFYICLLYTSDAADE